MIIFSSEGLDKKLKNEKLFFEIMDESKDKKMLQLVTIEDFFNDNEEPEHMVLLSIDFRAAYGLRMIPSKAIEWDGKMASAEEFTKKRPANKDVFMIRVPNGEDISKQVFNEGLFDAERMVYYGTQPNLEQKANVNPHFYMVPCRRSAGTRLILD